MNLFYLDASALVKRYVREPGSTWVRTLIDDPANVILISAISLVEVSAAIAICVRTGKLRPRQGGMAYEEFSDEVDRGIYQLWQVTQPLIEQAAELTQRHPLKGYDAVQVASGLQVAQHIAAQKVTLTFVSGDKQALDAATAEGLPVENPFDHTNLNSPLGREP